jgi:hypothetical protein
MPPMLPIVNIAATSMSARELRVDDPAPANLREIKFQITRTGPTTNALTVNLVPGGTVNMGAPDTTPIPTSVTIAAGDVGVELTIIVVDDFVVETPEWLSLTTGGSAQYMLGSNAMVTVYDNDTWRWRDEEPAEPIDWNLDEYIAGYSNHPVYSAHLIADGWLGEPEEVPPIGPPTFPHTKVVMANLDAYWKVPNFAATFPSEYRADESMWAAFDHSPSTGVITVGGQLPQTFQRDNDLEVGIGWTIVLDNSGEATKTVSIIAEMFIGIDADMTATYTPVTLTGGALGISWGAGGPNSKTYSSGSQTFTFHVDRVGLLYSQL